MNRADLKNLVYMQIAKPWSALNLQPFEGGRCALASMAQSSALATTAHCRGSHTVMRRAATRASAVYGRDTLSDRRWTTRKPGVATAYVTHEPCLRCTQDLIARGCKVIYFMACSARRRS